jgi:hypothetical protein
MDLSRGLGDVYKRQVPLSSRWYTFFKRDNGRGYRRRSRSPSEESDRPRKSKKRHRSDSSDRGRSRSPKSKKGIEVMR